MEFQIIKSKKNKEYPYIFKTKGYEIKVSANIKLHKLIKIYKDVLIIIDEKKST